MVNNLVKHIPLKTSTTLANWFIAPLLGVTVCVSGAKVVALHAGHSANAVSYGNAVPSANSSQVS